MRADGADVLHLPGTRFVTVGARGERTNRTDVDAGPALVALEMIAAVGHDFSRGAAIADTERAYAESLAANADTAIAKNTARRIVKHDRRPLFFVDVNLGFAVTALARSVAENHVLQFALAALVADRTIERMVGQQKFERAFACLSHLRRIGMHDHAFGHRERAGYLQFRRLLNFDQTHAAGGLQRQIVVVAERRDRNARFFGGIDQQRAGRGGQLLSVDRKFNWVSHYSLCDGDQLRRLGRLSGMLLQILFKLVAKLGDEASGRHCSRIAERAESAAEHVGCKLANEIDIRRNATAFVEARQNLFQPGRALTARNAPAAALVRIELDGAQRDRDDVGVFIEHDDAARTRHGLGFGQRVEIVGDVALIRAQTRRGGTARNDRLQLFAITHATADFIDDAHDGKAHRQFVDAGLFDMTRDADQTCAAVFGCTELGVPGAAVAEDHRNGRKCLAVVENGGRLKRANDSREGRFQSRHTALAFERFEQRGFFAAFVGARTGVRVKIEIPARAEDVLAEIAALVGFGDGAIDDIDQIPIFAADENVAFVGLDGPAGNHHTFNQLMRIVLHQQPILAGAGLALVRVTDDVGRLAGVV